MHSGFRLSALAACAWRGPATRWGRGPYHIESHLQGHHAAQQLVGHAQLYEQRGVHPHDAAAAGAHHRGGVERPDIRRGSHQQIACEESQKRGCARSQQVMPPAAHHST